MVIILLIILLISASFGISTLFLKKSFLLKGQTLESENRIEEALEMYKSGLVSEPNNPELHTHIGNIHFNRKKYQLAINSYKKVLEIDDFLDSSHKLSLQKKISVAQYRIKDFTSAFVTLQEITKQNKNEPEVYYLQGIICLKGKAIPEARNFLEKSYSLNKRDFKTVFSLAVTYSLEHDYDSSIKMFRIGEEMQTRTKLPTLLIGINAYLAGQYTLAEKKLKQTIGNKINTVEQIYQARRTLALLYIQQSDFRRANSRLKSLLEYTWENNREDLALKTLDDIGYNYIGMDNHGLAAESWKDLLPHENLFPQIRERIDLVTTITNSDNEKKQKESELNELFGNWIENAVTTKTIWDLAELKEKDFNISSLLQEMDIVHPGLNMNPNKIDEAVFSAYKTSAPEQFRAISDRIIKGLGFQIKEKIRGDEHSKGLSEGLNYRAIPLVGKPEETLIKIRRNDEGKLGDMPLHELLEDMEKLRCTRSVFISTGELTPGAKTFARKNDKIEVHAGKDLQNILTQIK